MSKGSSRRPTDELAFQSNYDAIFKKKSERVDLRYTPCQACTEGEYVETSLYDDWHGYLHCNVCNHEVENK